jgi:Clp amino terminal domain, pathogenicity island component
VSGRGHADATCNTGVAAAPCVRRATGPCDPSVVFERFTEQARQVVVLAQEEARTLKHNYIGTEHILLGLLREEEGLGARVLANVDITIERVRGQVVRIVGSGEEATSGQIPFTPRAKQILEMALREALSLGHDYIGPEHILLGLVRENDGVAARILLDFGADPETIRQEMRRMLSGPGPRRLPRGWTAGSPPSPRIERRGLDWEHASVLWRPAGLELRIPLQLSDGAIATFATDEVWSHQSLAGLRREIWPGWLALASPTLLEDLDPAEVRPLLDAAASRAADVSGRESGRVEDFLHLLRDQPRARP